MINAVIPRRLKTLNYEIGCIWAWCGSFHPDIMDSLRAHHETPDNLASSHEYFYPHEFGDIGDKPYPCDFKPFTALKRLRVAPVYVWGHDGFNNPASLAARTTNGVLWQALPPNLEQLWICRAEPQGTQEEKRVLCVEPDSLLPALHLFLDHKADFPKLDEVSLEFNPVSWPEDEDFENL
jgi:hypothetical protein